MDLIIFSMITLAIIMPNTNPVPSVRGGAIQTGVQHLVEQNEVFRDLDLIVVSPWDEVAEKKSSDYKSTRFVFIQTKKRLPKRLRQLFNSVARRMKLPFFLNPDKEYLDQAIKELPVGNDLDFIMVRNEFLFSKQLRQKKSNSKLLFSLHNDFFHKKNPFALRACKCFDEIFVVSSYIKKRVLDLAPHAESSVHVLKNAVDLSVFRHKKVSSHRCLKKYAESGPEIKGTVFL